MELFIREMGQGDTPVLALHCGLGQSGMWRGVFGDMPGVHVTAPDLPGHGKSPGFPEGVDVHDAATDAVRPLLSDGMHLVGHSFGATVALRLALEAPTRIRSLTLIEPVFFAAAPDGPVKADHRAAEEGFFAIAQAGDGMATAEEFNRLWGGGVPWAKFPEQVQQTMAAQMPFVFATEPSLWGDRAGMLRHGGLEALSCPVQLIRGGRTVPIIAQVHAGLLARLPNARETVVDGAGHMLVLSHPQAVADGVTDLLARSGEAERMPSPASLV
ncbi:alpha/beta fold hydrolase [Sagittula sp. S175]|uniref:alpha/beta fold hydrolase n=1 Tax=Sagittula sp. S175 TaxID=3415129 RepID=UPI003C7BCB57